MLVLVEKNDLMQALIALSPNCISKQDIISILELNMTTKSVFISKAAQEFIANESQRKADRVALICVALRVMSTGYGRTCARNISKLTGYSRLTIKRCLTDLARIGMFVCLQKFKITSFKAPKNLENKINYWSTRAYGKARGFLATIADQLSAVLSNMKHYLYLSMLPHKYYNYSKFKEVENKLCCRIAKLVKAWFDPDAGPPKALRFSIRDFLRSEGLSLTALDRKKLRDEAKASARLNSGFRNKLNELTIDPYARRYGSSVLVDLPEGLDESNNELVKTIEELKLKRINKAKQTSRIGLPQSGYARISATNPNRSPSLNLDEIDLTEFC